MSLATSLTESARTAVSTDFAQNDVLRAAEYVGLRAEIIEWQTRRMTLMAINVTFFAAVVGAMARGLEDVRASIDPQYLFVAVVLLQTLTVWMLDYMFQANAKLSAYIDVFHEEGIPPGLFPAYERRLAKLNERGWPTNINDIICVVIVVLATILAALVAVRGKEWKWMVEPLPLTSYLALVCSCLWCRLFRRDKRGFWREEWKALPREKPEARPHDRN